MGISPLPAPGIRPRCLGVRPTRRTCGRLGLPLGDPMVMFTRPDGIWLKHAKISRIVKEKCAKDFDPTGSYGVSC